MYKMILQEDQSFMSQEAMEAITQPSDWFASTYGTFVRVFGGHNS